MDKIEILKRNKKDSKNNDEYKRSVEKRASELAIYAITSLSLMFGLARYFGVDGTVLFLDEKYKLSSFMMVPLILYQAVSSGYYYYAYRKPKSLVWSCFCMFGVIVFFVRIFM